MCQKSDMKGQLAGDSGKSCSSSSKAEFSLAQGGQSFILFRLSTNWTRPTHIKKGNLLYSKSKDLNVNLIQKHAHRHIYNKI